MRYFVFSRPGYASWIIWPVFRTIVLYIIYAKDNASPKYRFSKHFGPGRENIILCIFRVKDNALIFGEITSAWNYVIFMCLLACRSFYSNKSVINRFTETLQQVISSTKRRLTFVPSVCASWVNLSPYDRKLGSLLDSTFRHPVVLTTFAEHEPTHQ